MLCAFSKHSYNTLKSYSLSPPSHAISCMFLMETSLNKETTKNFFFASFVISDGRISKHGRNVVNVGSYGLKSRSASSFIFNGFQVATYLIQCTN